MANRPRRTRFGSAKPFTKKAIKNVPRAKPIVYEGLTDAGTVLYAGTAKRGRSQGRLNEHKESGDLPGVTKFRYKQMQSIDAARQEERRIIKDENPKLNG